MTKRIRTTEPVQIDKAVKDRVAVKVVGTKLTIGQFFAEAAIEKLKQSSKK